MAKGQRSSRKKALRSVRRERVNATWQAAADAARLAALAKCVEAAPVPLQEHELARIEEAKAAVDAPGRGRGRGGGGDAMDTDGGGGDAGGGRGGRSGSKKGGKRGKAGKRGGGVVVRKGGRKKQVGALSKHSGNNFHKRKRK